jgi:hypothetical protein
MDPIRVKITSGCGLQLKAAAASASLLLQTSCKSASLLLQTSRKSEPTELTAKGGL